jgi:hypothetical protein
MTMSKERFVQLMTAKKPTECPVDPVLAYLQERRTKQLRLKKRRMYA